LNVHKKPGVQCVTVTTDNGVHSIASYNMMVNWLKYCSCNKWRHFCCVAYRLSQLADTLVLLQYTIP